MTESDKKMDGAEDLRCAVREGRTLGNVTSFAVEVGDENLQFKRVRIDDPVPLGRQILEAAGYSDNGDASLFAILRGGDFEDVRLDEKFDLRKRGAERFIAFCSDRDFRFELNGDQLQWGKPVISGTVLRRLAKASDDEVVFLEVKGGQDKLIEPGEMVNLGQPGVERFFSGPMPETSYEITINSRLHVLKDPIVTFELVIRLAFPDVHDPLIIYSMTYRFAASRPSAGDLSPGQSIQIKTGTQINVTPTGRA